MNRKQFLVLLAAAALLAAAGAGIIFSDRSDWKSADPGAGRKVVPGLQISEVAEIAIRKAEGELHLVKGAGGWTVRERADFAADTDRVAELLVKLAELKALQSESLPENQRARLQLVEPKDKAQDAGTVLELKDAKGATLARLLLGKKLIRDVEVAQLGRSQELPAGRYLLAGNDAGTMLVVADPFTQVDAKPEQWLVKDLARVEGARTITSTAADGKPRWTAVRENESADWKFAGSGVKPDLQKITDVASSLGWINLADVVADPARTDTGLDRAVTLKALTYDGLSYTVRIGKQAGDNYYLRFAVAGEPTKARAAPKNEKAEDKAKNDKEFEERRKKLVEKLEREKKLEHWTYLVARSGVDPLLRDRAQLMPEKKKPAKKG